MARLAKLVVWLLAALGLLAACLSIWLLAGGTGARQAPPALETRLARALRRFATPSAARGRSNPVPRDAAAIADGKAHFADHCATCHGNDGRGDTMFGRGMYPRPPDLRLDPTQTLSDGELFHIIENGVRLTGMPAFGDGSPESEAASWRLVHFIRHLPKLTASEIEEMKRLNPKSADEWREEERLQRFLEGGTPKPSPPPQPRHTHKHGGH